MSSPDVLLKFLDKIQRRGALPAEERQAFLGLPQIAEGFEKHQTIVMAGRAVSRCVFVGSGITSRVKTMSNGVRQIVAFNIPGDAPDLQSLLLNVADHAMYTHTLTQIVSVSHSDIRALIIKYPVLAEALWTDTLIEASISREWTVNVGPRRAIARIAHLLLEMDARFADSSRTIGSYAFPLSQTELSQAVALSLVHFNKSFQNLRRSRFIEFKDGRVDILNRQALTDLSGFDPLYLHLGNSSQSHVGEESAQNKVKLLQ